MLVQTVQSQHLLVFEPIGTFKAFVASQSLAFANSLEQLEDISGSVTLEQVFWLRGWGYNHSGGLPTGQGSSG